MSTDIERMQNEAVELKLKWTKGTNYMSTSAFADLDQEDKDLMRKQLYHMSMYLITLYERINKALQKQSAS